MAEPAPEAGPSAQLSPGDPAAQERRRQLVRYLGATSSWFGGWGVQQVMFPWLVVSVLQASATTTGITQMSVLLSNLALLLVGGAVADRIEPRRLLVALHLSTVLPIGLLLAAVVGGWLSLPVLLACGVMIGATAAFNVPARDSLLRQVAGGEVGQTVTRVTLVQFSSQLVGMAIAGSGRWIGTAAVLLAQLVALTGGALFARGLPERRPRMTAPGEGLSLSEMTAGIRIVWGSELRPVLLLVTGVGLFFMGCYHVVFPLLVRDLYDGTVLQLSLLMGMFPLGTILGSLVLLRLGGIRRKGRALAMALVGGGLFLMIGGLGLPYPGLVLTTFGWGLCGAVFMNMSRTLFQERAPEDARARVLAANQLGFLGAAPLGSLLAGYAVATFGSSNALFLLGGAMWILVCAVVLTTKVTRME